MELHSKIHMKYNIIRFFLKHLQVKLRVVPWHYDFSAEAFDGLCISNKPGDPQQCEQTIACTCKCMDTRPNLPICGICLGHQLMSVAAGAKTYKTDMQRLRRLHMSNNKLSSIPPEAGNVPRGCTGATTSSAASRRRSATCRTSRSFT